MTSNADIARAMAENMAKAAVPLYGKKMRLPDRGAIIGIIKEFRRLLFPAYFGDPQLMALPAENYAALLLALLILFAICPVVFAVIWVVRTVKGLVTKAAGAAGRKIEEKIEEEKEKHYVGGGI